MTTPPGPRVTPTPPPIGTCSVCKFWEAPDVTQLGRCHFNSPIVLTQVSAQTFWPQTEPDDWCGQFVHV